MSEQTMRENRTLIDFWDQAFAVPEEEKEAARREGVGSMEELAPAEKLLQAVSALGGRKKVLDYGCGNGWAAIAAAKSGCKEVTAADPAPNAVETARFLAELCDVSAQVRPVCGGIDWLKTVPAETYDGLVCSNVLDVIPPETAAEVLRELARVVTLDAEIVVGLNYEMTPEAAAERELSLADDRRVVQDGVLRMVSRSDAEWTAFFSPLFTVDRLAHFAWPGEDEEKRRLFHLRRRQRA